MKKLMTIATLAALVLTGCAKNPDAEKFDIITYDEVLARQLKVMDSTATSLSMDNKIPVLVFALKDPENIIRVIRGEQIGTIVKEK